MQPAAPDIRLEKVSFSFPGTVLFRELDFHIRSGCWTCLLGPSGCGKSTLLRLISGSLRQGVSGAIFFDGTPRGRGQTAWMAQKDLLLPWLSVLDNVLLGDRLRGRVTPARRQKARDLLQAVGLAHCAGDLPAKLSGGMRQRVALLRTLMEERPVILMDEPFSALDAITRTRLQDLAAGMLRGATVVLVTHDPLEALRLGHRIHVMSGAPVKMGPALQPPGDPPRKVDDPVVAGLHADLLGRLTGVA